MDSEFQDFWFKNVKLWFSGEKTDDYIKPFAPLLFDESLLEKNPYIYIIAHDQIPRHIFRGKPAIISYHLTKALIACNDHIASLQYCKDDVLWTWCLMPVKHIENNHSNLKVLLSVIWDRIKAQGTSPILKRFLMNTYKKYSMKVHGARRSIENFMFSTDLFAECTEPIINQSIESKESYQDLLEVVEKEYLTFAANQKEITLSLSGGVDSMVLFHILHLLRRKYCFKLNIVHINYNNRLICSREEKFVCCAAAKHGYTVFVRVFDEIKRSECIKIGLREFYERYTECGRFQAYLDVQQEGVPFVVLGHNMCDCVENIFTNISNNCGFDNLKGMTVMSEKVFANSTISESQAINIFRPLLTISKDNIRYYASVNNITHLQNSTPVWSQRGKLRNNVISVIEKWDKRFVPNLIKLATQNNEIYKFVNMRASQIYTNHFVNKQTMSLAEIQNTPVYVWSEIFRHFLNIQVSTKSIQHFMGKATKSEFKVVLTPVVTLTYSMGVLMCGKL